MRVAICDDEQIFRNELKNYIIQYKKNRRVQIDIYEFADGPSLFSSDLSFDILFLDYQMPDLDGMETARKLRQTNSICSIVFVTSYPEFVFESFEINPYRFLKKPISQNQIENVLNSYITQCKRLAPIIVNTDDGQRVVETKDIIYLEGDGKYCTIRTNKDFFRSSKTLSGVYELLPQYCFIRVHKSYAVNLYHIQKLNSNEIFFTNGERAIIGRSKIADFKRIYISFIKDYYLNL